MDKHTPLALAIMGAYFSVLILAIIGSGLKLLTKVDLFISLFHLFLLNAFVVLNIDEKYFLVMFSTIVYYTVTSIIYLVDYIQTRRTNSLIFFLHHLISIALIIYFFNRKSPEIQQFILQLIFVLNVSVIPQIFYEFTKTIPKECRSFNIKIYFATFFIFRIVVFPVFIIASIAKIKRALSKNEKIALSVTGILFYLVLWKWLWDLGRKI